MKKLIAILSVVLFANQASADELKGQLEVDRVYETHISKIIN